MAHYERPPELGEHKYGGPEALDTKQAKLLQEHQQMYVTRDARTMEEALGKQLAPGQHLEPVIWTPQQDGWNPWHAEEYRAGEPVVVNYRIAHDTNEG